MSECRIEGWKDGKEVFVVFDGVKIAKRGHPGTREAGTWVSIRPGWSVHDELDGRELVVEHDGIRRH